MNSQPLVSLCLPTNGVIEWVFPVLESIYSQDVNTSLFEVIVTDNGSNNDFKHRMKEYLAGHDNLKYEETNAPLFLNEIEAYKRASGKLIKFVNHRTLLIEGTLERLIQFVKDNENERPVIYFSNSAIPIEKKQYEYNSFNQFVKTLSYWSSWSTGMAIWKEDFEKLPEDVSGFNELFPHTSILFNERHRSRYIIDNSVIFKEMPQGRTPKGNYDLFFAFGVEYVWILCTLLRDKDITADTFRYVAERNLEFIAELYYDFCVRKEYCSYNLDGLESMYGVFYSKLELKRKVLRLVLKRKTKRIRKIILRILHKIYSLLRRSSK